MFIIDQRVACIVPQKQKSLPTLWLWNRRVCFSQYLLQYNTKQPVLQEKFRADTLPMSGGPNETRDLYYLQWLLLNIKRHAFIGSKHSDTLKMSESSSFFSTLTRELWQTISVFYGRWKTLHLVECQFLQIMKYLGVFQRTNNYKKATMFPLVHPNMRPTSRDDDLAQDPTPLFTRSVNPQTHMNPLSSHSLSHSRDEQGQLKHIEYRDTRK